MDLELQLDKNQLIFNKLKNSLDKEISNSNFILSKYFPKSSEICNIEFEKCEHESVFYLHFKHLVYKNDDQIRIFSLLINLNEEDNKFKCSSTSLSVDYTPDNWKVFEVISIVSNEILSFTKNVTTEILFKFYILAKSITGLKDDLYNVKQNILILNSKKEYISICNTLKSVDLDYIHSQIDEIKNFINNSDKKERRVFEFVVKEFRNNVVIFKILKVSVFVSKNNARISIFDNGKKNIFLSDLEVYLKEQFYISNKVVSKLSELGFISDRANRESSLSFQISLSELAEKLKPLQNINNF